MTTAIFLYIAILLPAIAFGSLNDESTRGEIGKRAHPTDPLQKVWAQGFSYYFLKCLQMFFPHTLA